MKQLVIVVSLCLILVSCSPKQNNSMRNNAVRNNAVSSTVTLRALGHAETLQANHWKENGKVWIAADQAAKLFHYQYVWEPKKQVAEMGYTDPLYKFSKGSKTAKVGDESVRLNEAPRVKGDKLYLEISSLSQLWQTPVKWDAKTNSVVVTPPNATPKNNGLKAESAGNAGNATEVIAFANRFMGTPYRFSAGPYNQTHAFDCSSFVQYVFGHVGIKLPRSSKSQSTVGQWVGRDALMPGDLIFFYTPGRYSSNRIVGHVGIYIGNNQMINTYGSPGVTITTLNANWNKRYLWSRRVL
ncbi:hypothetical protein D7Z26_21965 [Cohnella endophytica]|uniref:NlpC/P60 domain-containing protein n=1 Tax=Cohnella endophytica TaxID=2419778 RepID=A0A494XIH6_9BACL|nr:C40 family peptidase [Cohnella endophytica]RKP47884.1 hypothetical protein D7Z26_21965 [Cohnella endophytica]